MAEAVTILYSNYPPIKINTFFKNVLVDYTVECLPEIAEVLIIVDN